MDIISPNFVYAFILTRSKFELLPVILLFLVAELWPLIYVRILLAHLTNRLMVSYCDRWMWVVRRQQLLQTTSPKLLAGF